MELATRAKIKLSDEQTADLTTITEFNVAGRYLDYKLRFRKISTPQYTKKWFSTIKQYTLWLKKILREQTKK